MKAIILAAGLGMRLEKYIIPKCLVRIGQQTILERELDILKQCGIKDIIIVIGEKGGCWTDDAKEKIKRMHENVIINTDNVNTTNTYSLHLALEKIDKGPILTLDGDNLFEKKLIERIINNPLPNVMLSYYTSNPFERPNSKLRIEEGKIMGVGEKENSNLIYSGLMKIGEDLFGEIKKEITDNKYWDMPFSIPLDKLCKLNKIYNMLSDEGETEEELIETRPLVGGSYSQASVVNKIVRVKKIVARKEAYDEGKEKLIDEIKWLKDLPEELKPYFPAVLNYNINSTPVYFEMPNYELPTLRDLLIESRIDGEKAIEILKEITDFMMDKMYSKYQVKTAPNYLINVHINKTWKRFEEVQQKSEVFRKIIDCKNIFINGKRYANAPLIIKKVEKDDELLKLLEPPFVCKTHSDLHFDDMLIDILKTPPKFILIDPRGLDNKHSYEYDLGKLFFSFDGLYDLIHEGFFDLEMKFEDNDAYFEYKINNEQILEQYKKINDKFPKILSEYALLKNDKYWRERAKFTEAMLFLSNVPFQLRKDGIERCSVAQYITGVRLINEFWNWWADLKSLEKA